MSLTESIKEELDRECHDKLAKQNPKGEMSAFLEVCNEKLAVSGHFSKDSEWFIVDSVPCWQCHKHDALAARIADRVTEVGT